MICPASIEEILEFSKDCNPSLKNHSDKELAYVIFNGVGRFRLTPFGFDLLKSHFEHYSISISKNCHDLTCKELLAIVKNAKMPYYMHGKKFVTFDPQQYTHIILCGEKLDEWLYHIV